VSAEIRANAVEVAKVGSSRQAVCRIDGCDWHGVIYPAYQQANDERQAHLDWHRQQQAGGAQ
jgi:hypothetical protein